MKLKVVDNSSEKHEIKNKFIKIMQQNNLSYELIECQDCDKICVDFNNEDKSSKKECYNSAVIVQTRNKDICKIHPDEILYIAIEDRKSVLYLISERLETNYLLDYWKDILNPKFFAQPHHSFIVNLKYVNRITKEFVSLKCGDVEYLVYTSYRKIGAFKKAFLEFNE